MKRLPPLPHAVKQCLLAAALAGLPEAPAQAYDSIRFLPAVEVKEAKAPVAIAAAAERLYVLDGRSPAVLVYDGQGRLLKTAGRAGSGKEGFSSPGGVALGPDGRVYVADTGNSRVQMLGPEGGFLGSFGAKGSGSGQLRHPESLAVGTDGRVYVSDTGNDRVAVFDPEGFYLFGFGSKGKADGQLREPTRIAVDAADHVYVLDSGNGRVQRFDAGARFAKAFKLQAADLVVDAYGFIYLLDSKARKVREHAPDGAVLGSFGSKGAGVGQFKKAAGLAISPDGTLWMLDSGANRVQRAVIESKLKQEPLAPNTASKFFISGPIQTWAFSAAALSAREDGLLFAYLPSEGQVAALDREGKPVLRFGKKTGKEPSVTRGSLGLAASRQHGIFVADTEGDKLQRFDASGKFLANFADSTGFFDSKKKEGRVRGPHGMAVSGKGIVYAANTRNSRVEAFSAEGAFLFSIGPALGPHRMQEPVAVAWDEAGFVYILDRGLKRVFRCEPSGGLKSVWGEGGEESGKLGDPVALAYDGNGYVYVLDRGNRRISVFSSGGGWVTDFFSGGKDDKSLDDPVALAIQGDRLFVSDRGKGRISVFALHPRLAPPAGVTASAAEGVVSVGWAASTEPWTAQYRVWRSSAIGGPFEPLAQTSKTLYQDPGIVAQAMYYYRVAIEAKTRDVGAMSRPAAAYVPAAANRPTVEIASVEIGNIFSASYKYYQKNPVGRIVVANNRNVPFEKVKVSFRLKDFMDFGTDAEIPRLAPQERRELALKAVLNNRILEVTEDTPIQAEFALTYFDEGKPQTVSLTKPLRVYSRNAIVWDKPERIATFITSNDTPVKDFQRRVIHEALPLPERARALDSILASVLRLWHALGAAGLKYQPSPNNPFEQVSVDPAFPEDLTQFPRETLKRKSGECDDLATLSAAMLEAAGIRTALLDYPGHIALMFDTDSADPAQVGLPEDRLIRYGDSYWIPFEPTVMGASFADAHRQALETYRRMEKSGKARILDPRKAWLDFEPATMPPTEWGSDVPGPESVASRAEADALYYAKERRVFLGDRLKARLEQDPEDVDAVVEWGILELEGEDLEKASERFSKALELDPDDAAALNNRGSVAFLKQDFSPAMGWFLKASDRDPADPGILLNLAKTAAKLKDADKTKEYGDRAAELDPDLKPAVQALLQ